jgi:hypothetical protein
MHAVQAMVFLLSKRNQNKAPGVHSSEIGAKLEESQASGAGFRGVNTDCNERQQQPADECLASYLGGVAGATSANPYGTKYNEKPLSPPRVTKRFSRSSQDERTLSS